MSKNKYKWMPLSKLKPGRKFIHERVTYLRIKGFTTIGKEPLNLVHIPTGELGWLDCSTAVKVKV